MVEQASVPQFRLIPRLPAVTRDLSSLMSYLTRWRRVRCPSCSGAPGGELCESVELVAQFSGGSLADGQKDPSLSASFVGIPRRVELAEEARTLTDKEVDEVVSVMLKAAQAELGATLRG